MNLFLTALLFFLGTISFSQSNDPIAQIQKEAPEIGSRTVAITIDDVPNTRLFVRDGNQSRLLKQLDSLKIPATIFINEGLIQRGDPKANTALLESWIGNQFVTCGNHTFAHSRYSESSFEAFTSDIKKGNRLTDSLAKLFHKGVPYFRFPYNDLGSDSLQNAQIKTYLGAENYILAPFTIESSDWMFNTVYEHYLNDRDTVKAHEIGQLYIQETLKLFAFYDSLAFALYQRPVHQIYLCHDNTINADYLHQLVTALNQRNYTCISMTEALTDPVYAQTDHYTKKWGISWFYRWIEDPEFRKQTMMTEPAMEALDRTYEKVTAQSNQFLEDYKIFKNVLTSSHPSLYRYTTKSQWDSLFLDFEAQLPSINNSEVFFRELSELAQHVHDGHLLVLHPNMDSIPPMFPILIKIIGGHFFTDTEDFGIPVGSEILSIDGLGASDILSKLLKYTASDGFNTTKKHRQIEMEFGILYAHEFGLKESFTVSFKTPNQQVDTTEISSQSFQSIGMRNAHRNSHAANCVPDSNTIKHFRQPTNPKLPTLYFRDSRTAVLTVNTFALEPQEFKSELIEIFKEIKRKKTLDLVIDVRRNNGGYRANAIILYSFIAEKPFAQRISESVVSQTLFEPNSVVHALSDYEEFFKTYFADSEKQSDRWVLTTDHAAEMMTPYKRTFKGQTYVIIGGNTFSAGSAFALNAKNDPDILLFGEETGGGYYTHTGQFPVLYELPLSKIRFYIFLVQVNHFTLDTSVPQGSGIFPDYTVELTQQDLIDKKDTPLEVVMDYISKSRKRKN